MQFIIYPLALAVVLQTFAGLQPIKEYLNAVKKNVVVNLVLLLGLSMRIQRYRWLNGF